MKNQANRVPIGNDRNHLEPISYGQSLITFMKNPGTQTITLSPRLECRVFFSTILDFAQKANYARGKKYGNCSYWIKSQAGGVLILSLYWKYWKFLFWIIFHFTIYYLFLSFREKIYLWIYLFIYIHIFSRLSSLTILMFIQEIYCQGNLFSRKNII